MLYKNSDIRSANSGCWRVVISWRVIIRASTRGQGQVRPLKQQDTTELVGQEHRFNEVLKQGQGRSLLSKQLDTQQQPLPMPPREMPWSGKEGHAGVEYLKDPDVAGPVQQSQEDKTPDYDHGPSLSPLSQTTQNQPYSTEQHEILQGVSSDQQQDPAHAKTPEQQDLGGPDGLQYDGNETKEKYICLVYDTRYKTKGLIVSHIFDHHEHTKKPLRRQKRLRGKLQQAETLGQWICMFCGEGYKIYRSACSHPTKHIEGPPLP